MFHQNHNVMPLDAYLREAESYYVQNVLNLYEGNITKAANALGMSRQNLQYRIRKIKTIAKTRIPSFESILVFIDQIVQSSPVICLLRN